MTKDQPRDDGDGTTPLIVVGIGASAGGLEALSALVSNLPQHRSITYVVAQHMSPQHKSMMVDLLSRSSRVAVVEATEGHSLEPDTIYITPPNRNIEIRDRTVVLSEPFAEGPKPSVDLLFTSLAEDNGEHTIGIVLSGTGSDGAHGIEIIKAAGGFTIVQSPESAKYGSMPEAALRTGKVDLVLAPDQVGGELAAMSSTPRELTERHSDDTPTSTFAAVIDLIRHRTNIDFLHYKPGTIQRRIQRRVAANRLATVEDYLDFMSSNPAEIEKLCADILISVTSFFRDRDAFAALRSACLNLLERQPPRTPVRVWVPGCATGEEAYSVAIVIAECLRERRESRPVQIFAVDIDDDALAAARRGHYPASSVEAMEPTILDRYLTRVDETYQINRELRDMVVFSRQDLTKDPPFSRIDMVTCRNLLIYFNTQLQQRVIELFAYALNPGGIMFLGKSESLGPAAEGLFTTVDRTHKIFTRNPGRRVPLTHVSAGRGVDLAANKLMNRPKAEAPPLPQLVKSTIGEIYGPPSIVVDTSLRLMYMHGDVSSYLKLADGTFEQDILQLINPALRTTLMAALHRADRVDHAPVSLELKAPSDDQLRNLRITVRVMPDDGPSGGSLRLISFETIAPEARAAAPASGTEGANDFRVGELEQELTATREHLQTVIQELETANEELQATNEELQSSNEELQATNEELETTNEELQSTNEELETVNDELQAKSNELYHRTADLENIQSTIEASIILVDAEQRIRLFNDAAREAFVLATEEIGRPLTQVAPRFDMPDLKLRLSEVIRDGESFHADVVADEGRTLTLTINPYRVGDRGIAGAVLTLTDVSERARNERRLDELSRELRQAQRIAEIGNWRYLLRSGAMVWSEECYRIAGVNPHTYQPSLAGWIDLFHEDDRDVVRTDVETALRDKTSFGFQRRMQRHNGEVRHVRVEGRAQTSASGELEALFGVVKDVTVEVTATKLMERSHARLSKILDTIADGVGVIDTTGKLLMVNQSMCSMFGYGTKELLGQNVSMLMPEAIASEHDDYLEAYLRTGEGKIIGSSRQVDGKRADGSQFPVELFVGEVKEDPDTPGGLARHLFIGTMRDMSARMGTSGRAETASKASTDAVAEPAAD